MIPKMISTPISQITIVSKRSPWVLLTLSFNKVSMSCKTWSGMMVSQLAPRHKGKRETDLDTSVEKIDSCTNLEVASCSLIKRLEIGVRPEEFLQEVDSHRSD